MLCPPVTAGLMTSGATSPGITGRNTFPGQNLTASKIGLHPQGLHAAGAVVLLGARVQLGPLLMQLHDALHGV